MCRRGRNHTRSSRPSIVYFHRTRKSEKFEKFLGMQFVEKCFQPFSVTTSDHGVYLQLLEETRLYTAGLQDLVKKRMVNLHTGLYPDLQRKIKLPEADLKLTIAYTAKLMEELYPNHVIARLEQNEEDFWESQNLSFRDWKGLAAKKLKDIFSPSFLTPLEETDNYFELKVNHMNIERYGEMLNSAKFHDDLDVIVELHMPEISESIDVTSPKLDVSYFNPQIKLTSDAPTLRKTCQSGIYERRSTMEIPLPILHPANIAVFIYNRENDQDPINLDGFNCQRIIQATKEVPYIDFTDLSSMEPSHTELSTPDNMTTESLTLTSHLAVQERSFSDDAVSSHCISANTQSQSPKSGQSGAMSLDYEPEEDQKHSEKIVYCEVEKDTSCVLEINQTVNDENRSSRSNQWP